MNKNIDYIAVRTLHSLSETPFSVEGYELDELLGIINRHFVNVVKGSELVVVAPNGDELWAGQKIADLRAFLIEKGGYHMKFDEWLKKTNPSGYNWEAKYLLFQGLPGSGKTDAAKKFLNFLLSKSNGASVVYMNVDEKDFVIEDYSDPISKGNNPLMLVDGLYDDIPELVTKLKAVQVWIKDRNDKHFTVNSYNVEQCLLGLVNLLTTMTKSYQSKEVDLVYFTPDVKLCKKNDEMRGRDELALASIDARFLTMKPLAVEGKVYNVDVATKSESDEEFLITSWETDFEDAEKVLDNYLEKAYPTITFLQYKKMKKECVETLEERFHDYYDEKGTMYYRLRINLKKMKEMLG